MRRKRPAAPAAMYPAIALAAIAGLGCKDHGMAARDAAGDGLQIDAASPLTLDIGVSGCGHYDVEATCDPDAGVGPCCTGSPPLTLSFAPVGSRELTQFLWDFGDGAPASAERAPSHTYAHPGEFRVTLVGGASNTGMITPPHPLAVVVQSLTTGALCDADAQCAGGLSCVCRPGAGCPAAFVRGFCSMACDTIACGPGAVCAALSVIPAPDGGAGADAPVCIASCQTNADCAPGLACETVPSGSAAAAAPWTRGCLPLGALQDVGAPCRDANEALDDGACTTGLCADIGALGICSATCDDSHPCPDEAACVLPATGQSQCLLTCAASDDCARDPLLACAPAARAGASAGAGDVMVCSPKSCSSDAACAPSGHCGPKAFCIRGRP